MSDFWKEVINSRLEGRNFNQAWADLSQKTSFRPTIYIGVGGFGCTVVRELKKKIENLIPKQQIREGFAFIGLDTQVRDRTDLLTETEYIELSIGILPNKVAKDPTYSQYLEWYSSLARKWRARSIRGGANKVRAVGRLALLYPPTLNAFFSNLGSALNQVMNFRSNFSIKAIPKVYVISSLGGGTGAGAFLDVFLITTQHLKNQFEAEFQLQAILATPEALEGEAKHIDFPDFYANTYTSLKEILHFILGNEEFVFYDIQGQGFNPLKASSEHIPHNLYLITDRNRNGRIIVDTFPDLTKLIISYLLFEIQTPLETEVGQPKPQDGENVRFSDSGHGEMPRAFSSFGVVRFGLPYEEVEELLALSLIHRAINDELSGYVKDNVAESWVKSNRLAEAGSDQLQERIRRDREEHEIKVYIDTQGLDLLEVINKFYSDDRMRDDLFTSIIALGSPLFPLNSGKKESGYSDDYVVAVHPSIRNDFLDLFGRCVSDQAGIAHAYFTTPYEIIIYSISRGYTVHSLTTLNTYKAHYHELQEKYERASRKGKSHRPIHAWSEAAYWEEVTPRPIEKEKAQKWFIVGRAFSCLFSTALKEDKPDERTNKAFIFKRNDSYYLTMEDTEPSRRIGDSLGAAVMNFEVHPEWQNRVKELAEAKIEEVGKSQIKERIENEYIPIIEDEIEVSERDSEYERLKVLKELFKALRKFIKEDLRERRI